MYIDSHFHLRALGEKGEDIPALLSRMEKLGMEGIDIGTEGGELEERKKVLSGHPSFALSAGIGPWSAGSSVSSLKEEILAYGPICAIGEIGLDNHWKDYPSPSIQETCLQEQMDLADELGKPIIIHTREADEKMREILFSRTFPHGGIMHCYEGSRDLMETALDKGFMISFSGALTFKANGWLRELSLSVPEDHLLFETDSPYLAPTPYRGRVNTPPYVAYVYKAYASFSGKDEEKIASAVRGNLRRFLRRDDRNG